MSRSRWDEDDEEYHPVYKGSRNYDSVGAKVGEAFNDLAVSVRRAAGAVLEDPAVSKKAAEANKTWQKAKHAMFGDEDSDDDRRGSSRLPDNCFCDMRGFACPRHRGREKWRFGHDFKLHVQHNVDSTGSASETALGAGSKLAGATFGEDVIKQAQAAAGLASRDADMAQLVQMGFDPTKVAEALVKHTTLDAATNALLDDPDSAARDEVVGQASQLPEPPSAPPPHPPGSSSGAAAASVSVLAAPPGSHVAGADGPNLICLDEVDGPPPPRLPSASAPVSSYLGREPMLPESPLPNSLPPPRPPPGVMTAAGEVPMMVHGQVGAGLAAPAGAGPMPALGFSPAIRQMGGMPDCRAGMMMPPPAAFAKGYPPSGFVPHGYAARGGLLTNGMAADGIRDPMQVPVPQFHPMPMRAGWPAQDGFAGMGGLNGCGAAGQSHSPGLAPYGVAHNAAAPATTLPGPEPAYTNPPLSALVRGGGGSLDAGMRARSPSLASAARGCSCSAFPQAAPDVRCDGGAAGGARDAQPAPPAVTVRSGPSNDEGLDGFPAWLSSAQASLSCFAASTQATAAAAHPTAPQPAPAPAPGARPEPCAAACWTMGTDRATGRTYYYNLSTQASQWDRPADLAPASPGAAAVHAETAPSAAIEAPLGAPTRPPPLPAGWQSGVDPKTGVVYYCNASLNVTQWEHPASTL